jgi:hypothetical protein
MIVNPPRTEAEFSSRLRTIAVQAADKNEDPDDRPPLIPRWVRRRLAVLVPIFFVAATIRGGLWVLIHRPEWSTSHEQRADMFRQLTRETEAEAMTYRAIVTTGKSAFVPRLGIVVDPIMAKAMATRADKQAAAYRWQAYTEESMNQGFPIR